LAEAEACRHSGRNAFLLSAHLDTTYYPAGTKVSKQELSQLSIRQKRVLPKWNYTISPQV
jgi:hypothetical protein